MTAYTEPAVPDCAADCLGQDPHPGIIHLSTAPRINHRIRFAPLQTKTPAVFLPQAAVSMVKALKAKGSTASSTLISGPGDPLAEIEATLETVRQIRDNFPELTIVVQTLGIHGIKHADKLQKEGVSEVQLLIDGVDPAVIEKIYAWIRPGFKTLKLSDAAEILQHEQAQAIQAFKDAGIYVRVVSTLYPTINEDQFEVLAKKITELGADELCVHPYTPPVDADIILPKPDQTKVATLIGALANILPTLLGRPVTQPASTPADSALNLPKPKQDKPNVAVVSSNGMDVNLHLGQAPQLLVYGPREDGLNCLLECRPAPEAGTGKERWDILAESIDDCFALLTASAGERPQRVLDSHGIQVLITQDNIEGTVDKLYGGPQKKSKHSLTQN